MRETLQSRGLSIETASLGTWIVIIEKISKDVRDALCTGDPDQIARVRRAFGDLGHTGIERLVAKELLAKFKGVVEKRNWWHGHSGFVSVPELQEQVASLWSDLRELRQLLGDVWGRLVLVRAGKGGRITRRK